MKRRNNFLFLKVLGKTVCYEIKQIFPFDAVRKIMSVVVKSEQGDYIIFTKGADTSMINRLNSTPNQKQKIQKRADKMALNNGCRTMVMAMRYCDNEMMKKLEYW